MAVAFDAETHDKATGGAFSFAHTCTGANLALFLFVQERHASGVTGATYNGVAMTQISYNDPGSNLVTQKVFRLIAPATGAHNIVLSPASVPNRTVCSAISLTGVDQTTPNGTVVTSNGGASTAITDNVTSATGEIVLDGATIMEDTVGTATLTVGAGQTQMMNQEQLSGGIGLVGASSREAGAASVTMSWTASVASYWVHSSFAVKSAAGDTVAPGNALVTASELPTGTAIALQITMPADGDLANFEVRRLTTDYPANNRSNGTVVVAATATSPSAVVNFTDTGLTNGQRYFYRVFCNDSSANWNAGTTVSEVAATAMTPVGWYTAGGTLVPSGETGASPIFEWTIDTADVEASKPVPFHLIIGSDNPGPNLPPTQDVLEFLSTDFDGTFKYFTGGTWVTIPDTGVPWAAINAGAVTCRFYSSLNANQDLYASVRPEQA